MGMTFHVRCKGCDLTADVSGGRDRGFFISTETMFCASCQTLVDVLTGYTNDPSHPIPSSMADKDARFGHCPRCNGEQLTPWRLRKPCPRCGGEIEMSGIPTLWD